MADEVKVVLVGGSGSGKSGLIIRLITEKFQQIYDPTIEEKYTKILSVDGQEVTLDILDTAGQKEFQSMEQFWFREGEIFLIVYSIDSMKTFEEISHFARKVSIAKQFDLSELTTGHSKDMPEDNKKPFIIVGNKCDLEDKREVSKEAGEELAKKWGVPFFECSAYTETNLRELWVEAVRLARNIEEDAQFQRQKTEDHKDDEKSSFCKECLCGGGRSSKWNADGTMKKATDDIQFFAVKDELPEDNIGPPILALKNFRITRNFDAECFFISLALGAVLPLTLIMQTLVFICYSEHRDPFLCCGAENINYEDDRNQILLDFLGLIVGRQPGQDPETARDRKWFLRQTMWQKIFRVFLVLLVCFAYFIMILNLTEVNNERVSRQETAVPFAIYVMLWILLSGFIAYQPEIYPPLPPMLWSRLRSTTLYFGEYFTHKTSAYKFLRAYGAARQDKQFLSLFQWTRVIGLSLLFALAPGITRSTIGAEGDGIDDKVFWTADDFETQAGAFVVNFMLIAMFMSMFEYQYSKHFDTYREWMKDVTLLLSKETMGTRTRNGHRKSATLRDVRQMIEIQKSQPLQPHKYGRDFSKHLFLSLTRRSNALAWLEIRSFLLIEGKLLFGGQELPIFFLMCLTLFLAGFISWRVYFITDSLPYESILWNGAVVLLLICVVSLVRVIITAYAFDTLQRHQMRLLGEQKLWMRCSASHRIGHEHMDLTKAFGLQPHDRKLSLNSFNSQSDDKLEIVNGDDRKEDDNDDDDGDENTPFLSGKDEVQKGPTKDDVLERVDTAQWYTYNFGFLDDAMFLVDQKDIYPRLFRVKLNSVLAKAIVTVFISTIFTFFRLAYR